MNSSLASSFAQAMLMLLRQQRYGLSPCSGCEKSLEWLASKLDVTSRETLQAIPGPVLPLLPSVTFVSVSTDIS